MQVRPTEIPDVLIIEPKVFPDDRGFFFESYQRERFVAAGIDCDFVQDNHARSVKNTLRGLHFQRAPGQAKLVRATRGRIIDVAADIRRGSATFGKWVAVELSEENHRMLFMPIGIAHGYAVVSDIAEVQYKCSHRYLPEQEVGIAWNDPDIAVEWPVPAPVLSERDDKAPTLREYMPDAFE